MLVLLCGSRVTSYSHLPPSPFPNVYQPILNKIGRKNTQYFVLCGFVTPQKPIGAYLTLCFCRIRCRSWPNARCVSILVRPICSSPFLHRLKRPNQHPKYMQFPSLPVRVKHLIEWLIYSTQYDGFQTVGNLSSEDDAKNVSKRSLRPYGPNPTGLRKSSHLTTFQKY